MQRVANAVRSEAGSLLCLDLCCGRGGDLHKWKAVRATRLVMVDSCFEAVAEAAARYNVTAGLSTKVTPGKDGYPGTPAYFGVWNCFAPLTTFLKEAAQNAVETFVPPAAPPKLPAATKHHHHHYQVGSTCPSRSITITTTISCTTMAQQPAPAFDSIWPPVSPPCTTVSRLRNGCGIWQTSFCPSRRRPFCRNHGRRYCTAQETLKLQQLP